LKLKYPAKYIKIIGSKVRADDRDEKDTERELEHSKKQPAVHKKGREKNGDSIEEEDNYSMDKTRTKKGGKRHKDKDKK
jgi:hypothetical protein